MRGFWKWIFVFGPVLWIASQRSQKQSNALTPLLNNPEPLDVILTPLLQQSDDQFGYTVVSRALDRSADGNRFLDTLFLALMAAQAAIYAIILDKLSEYPVVIWQLLLGAFISAIVGTALTGFVREGPDPEEFALEFPDDPEGTRNRYIDEYIAKAKRNERVRVSKMVVLALSLGLTVVPLIIATAGKAGVSVKVEHEKGKRHGLPAAQSNRIERAGSGHHGVEPAKARPDVFRSPGIRIPVKPKASQSGTASPPI